MVWQHITFLALACGLEGVTSFKNLFLKFIPLFPHAPVGWIR